MVRIIINFLVLNCITKDSGTVKIGMTFQKPRNLHALCNNNNDFITVFLQKVALTNFTSQKEHEGEVFSPRKYIASRAKLH